MDIRLVQTKGISFQEQVSYVEKGEGICFAHETNARIAENSPNLSIYRLNCFSHTIGLCWLKKNKHNICKNFAELWLECSKVSEK